MLDEPLLMQPPPPPESKLRPEDIIQARPAALKGPLSLTSSSEFREDIALVVHAIAEQYIKVCVCLYVRVCVRMIACVYAVMRVRVCVSVCV